MTLKTPFFSYKSTLFILPTYFHLHISLLWCYGTLLFTFLVQKKNHFKIFFFSFTLFLMSFSILFFIYSTAFPIVLYWLLSISNYTYKSSPHMSIDLCFSIFLSTLFLTSFHPLLFSFASLLFFCLFFLLLFSFTLSFLTK